MRIRCPYCGERGSEEFTCHGDVSVRRPDINGAGAAERFVDYVYFRDNPAGVHYEYWYHGAGCRAWLKVCRDTRTHLVSSVVSVWDSSVNCEQSIQTEAIR